MKAQYTINWELSLACNLDCSFCSQTERRKAQSRILSLQEIYRIIDHLPASCHISFLGGETLMHKHIAEIFARLEQRQISYEITTNGSFLKKHLPLFSSLGYLTHINISLDGAGSYHNTSRGQIGLYESIMSILPELQKIVPVHISTVMTPEISDKNLLQLSRDMQTKGVKQHKYIYMMNFDSDDIQESVRKIPELRISAPAGEKIDQIEYKKWFLRKMLLLKSLHSRSPLIEPKAILQDGSKSCKQIHEQFRINERGEISICEFINNSFGDLTQQSFEAVIQNKDYKNIQEKISKNFPLDICKTCCKLIAN